VWRCPCSPFSARGRDCEQCCCGLRTRLAPAQPPNSKFRNPLQAIEALNQDSYPAVADGTFACGQYDFKKTEYGGPCPLIGQHRYFHKLYALDDTLDLTSGTKSQIERAMQDHVLANTELIGTYQKGDGSKASMTTGRAHVCPADLLLISRDGS
jgi:Phosphatidylethanolamine-binding protein